MAEKANSSLLLEVWDNFLTKNLLLPNVWKPTGQKKLGVWGGLVTEAAAFSLEGKNDLSQPADGLFFEKNGFFDESVIFQSILA